jgi:di/tripeptidase
MGSTDANVPMSLGIPAVTVGSGSGARAHALDEWVTVEPKADVQAVQVALAVILTTAGFK